MASDALHSHNFGCSLAELVAERLIDLANHPHHHAGRLLRLLIVGRRINRYDAFLVRWRADHLDVTVIATDAEGHIECLHHLDNLLPRPVFRQYLQVYRRSSAATATASFALALSCHRERQNE